MEETKKSIGAQLKALDKFEKTCIVCGAKFIASNRAKFCSNRCTQRNKYAKIKAKREAEKLAQKEAGNA